jgi:DNA modification methylase
MSKINLTEEELTKLLEAVNAGTEPTPELAGKLFPTLMEKLGQEGKFDFETLNRIKIPTIEYAGKRSEGVILASAAALGQSAPLQVVRSFGELGEDGWRNFIIQGDNLQFLKTAYLNQDPLIRDKVKGKVKLIYIDPPFATKSDFQGGDYAKSYSDKIDSAEFIENLRERLIFLREMLTEDGAIYVHLDMKKGHYLKIILDEIFGDFNFQNEVIWKRTPFAGSSKARANKFPINHDNIYFYSKTQNYLFNQQYVDYSDEYKERFKYKDDVGYYRKTLLKTYSKETEERLKREDRFIAPERVGAYPSYKQYLHESKGKQVEDIWTDINLPNPMAGERVEYPTQKPEALLERIIKASTNFGDIVMDVFSGSGTTAATAEKLSRRWIACDFGKHSIYTMQKRILRIAESKAFDATKKDAKYGQLPKAFAVASVGAYDFSRIMNLRENKCAYISFVLALFGIPKEKKDYVAKYKLDHIYAEKDGDPAEIFPVWDDQFLYNVRINQDYLKDIITQSRGRLKGNFYIIVPESCTQVSDMKLPNGSGGEVHFRFLKFPYSILEQASRNFAIEDQPDTAANINNLVSSVGFYFNDEVTVKVFKNGKGLKIAEFKTPILNREGAAYEGRSGLSLLLVDIDYNGEVFDMEHAIYAKDIPDNGEIPLAGVSSITAVIAVDRHGNESKPTLISE